MSDISSLFRGLQVAGILLSLCIHIPVFYGGNGVSTAIGELYSDEDGESTRETYSSFSRRSRRHVMAHLAVGVIALGINCVAAVLRFREDLNLSDRSRLLNVSVWVLASVCLSLQ